VNAVITRKADAVLTHLAETGRARARLAAVREALQVQRTTLEADITALQAEITVLGHCAGGFDALLAAMSAESLTSVERLLTYGLQTAFPAQGLACRLEASTKRGQQAIDVRLVHATTGGVVDAPVLDAFGGGPASVISFLLRLLVVRRAKLAPVLLLDEAFAFVSAEYIGGVARLLRELADKLGLTIVLVTHQPAFLDVAHVAYRIGKGADGSATFTEVTPA
jgi:DNA repair ATPase RecN